MKKPKQVYIPIRHINQGSVGSLLERVRKALPGLDEGSPRIRSGRYIPDGSKDIISSYSFLGSQISSPGYARIDVITVKRKLTYTLELTDDDLRSFAAFYLKENKANAVFILLPNWGGTETSLFFCALPPMSGVSLPPSVSNYLCRAALRQYLMRRCALNEAAVNGFLSTSYDLFDDSVISAKAPEIDAALRDIVFCDISAGNGALLYAMRGVVAGLRLSLGKYPPFSKERRREALKESFSLQSMYATDIDSGAIEILKARIRYEQNAPCAALDSKLVWGNILTEDLFSKGSFDIIVTNPHHMKESDFSFIKEQLARYSTAKIGADLYCYYTERIFELLKPGGTCGLFMADGWMRSSAGEGLRELLSRKNIIEIVNYGNKSPVEGIAASMSAIIAGNEEDSGSARVTDADGSDIEDMCSFTMENSIKAGPLSGSRGGWFFLPEGVAPLLDKIKKTGEPLSHFVDGRIYRGILTGLNEAFVITEEKAQAIAAESPSCSGIIHPFLSGRDVKRYKKTRVRKYLIDIPKGYTDARRGDTEPEEWFRTAFPAAARHLLPFAEPAAARRDKGDYWWELRSCSYGAEFEKKKLICPGIAKRVSATSDGDALFSNDKTFIIVTDSLYLLGIINSGLADFYIRQRKSRLLNDYFEIRRGDLADLPIVRTNKNSGRQSELMMTVEKNAALLSELYSRDGARAERSAREAIAASERALNMAVYELFGLTAAERRLVENY